MTSYQIRFKIKTASKIIFLSPQVLMLYNSSSKKQWDLPLPPKPENSVMLPQEHNTLSLKGCLQQL